MGVVLLHGNGRHVGVICFDCNNSNDGRKVLLFALRLLHRKCSGVRRKKSIMSNEKCSSATLLYGPRIWTASYWEHGLKS